MNNPKDSLNTLKEKAKAFLFSWNVLVFLFFVLISTIFWFTISLNKTYEYTVPMKIRYINVPSDVEFSADLITEIDVKVKEKGVTILAMLHSKDSLTFNFDEHQEINDLKKISIPSSSLFDKQIKENYSNSTVIIGYYPDVITIEKGVLKSKNVPVVVVKDITYDGQFCASDSCKVSPSSVKVYAPQNMIDTLHCIYTKKLTAHDLNDTLVSEIGLVFPERFKSDTKYAKVTIPVEIYIEGTTVVPVKVINVPKQYTVKVIPNEVEVKYNVGKSKFNKIKANGFSLNIDYNDIISSNSKTQYINIAKTPTGVTNCKLMPESVEYIVY